MATTMFPASDETGTPCDAIDAAVAAFRAAPGPGMQTRMAAAIEAARPHLVDDFAIRRGGEAIEVLQELAREGTDVSIRWGSEAIQRAAADRRLS